MRMNLLTESRSTVTHGQKEPGRWMERRDYKAPKETFEGDGHVPVLIVLMCVDMCVQMCGGGGVKMANYIL